MTYKKWTEQDVDYLIENYGSEQLTDMAHMFGVSVTAVIRKANSIGLKRDYKEKGTLCWTCQRATGGCSWSKRFQPVDGWDARKTVVKSQGIDGMITKVDSYFVNECPKYLRDKSRSTETAM